MPPPWSNEGEPPDTAAPAPRPPPDVSQFRIPGEFEPLRALWLGYDAGHAELTADLVAALHAHVRLEMLVSDDASAEAARALLHTRGLGHAVTGIHVERLSMYFLRDAAVFATGPNRELGVVDFQWNHYGLPGWCATRHAGDPQRERDCTANTETTRNDLDRAIAGLVGAHIFPSALTMEGGGVESNGRGLLIANETLVRQRNPGRSRAELERLHLALPGVRKVIWLPDGLAEDPQLRATITANYVAWGTGGHTDEFVRFADAGTVLLAWPDDADVAAHPVARLNRQRMQRNFEILARSAGIDGVPLRVVKVPMPRIIERRIFLSAGADPAWSQEWTADYFPPRERRREGDAVMQVASASYLNFIIANGVVVVPGYERHGTPHATQERVRRLFEAAFPTRRVVFIDALGANWVGGGPHCATLHEPMPSALPSVP